SNQRGQHIAHLSFFLSECEVNATEYSAQFVVHFLLRRVRLEDAMRRANFILGFFYRFESASCEKRKNGRTQAGHALRRHENRTPESVGIDSVKHLILLRNSARVDDPLHSHAFAFHAIKNHPGMQSSSLNRGK